VLRLSGRTIFLDPNPLQLGGKREGDTVNCEMMNSASVVEYCSLYIGYRVL
jgi:hypothetical protein